jgi:ABC-type lipoprotein release transport system permease subunit
MATLIAGAGWLASYLPARGGTRVDPVETLRAG